MTAHGDAGSSARPDDQHRGNGPVHGAADLVQAAAAETAAETLQRLGSGTGGLSDGEAARRLARNGPNVLPRRRVTAVQVLLRQVKNPILVLLVVAAVLSAVTGDRADAVITLVILTVSVGLGFVNEWRAEQAASALHAQVSHQVVVIRDGAPRSVDVASLVPGDVVRVGLGTIVPADLRVLDATDLSCDESVVTGESVPVDKSPDPVAPGASLGDLSDCLLMGTVVHQGSGTGVVVATAADATFGRIAAELNTELPQTGFQKGLSQFSMFLLWVALGLTVFIFVGNTLLHRPLLSALTFALAIAVGITPQLLPAVVNTSLAAGSRALARQKVLVKRLLCIEDLGNVDILVTDKTGTLTDGHISYRDAYAATGYGADDVVRLGLLDSETDLSQPGATSVGQNPIDQALADAQADRVDLSGFRRLDLRPFNHDTRTVAVLVEQQAGGARRHLIKGAPEAVLPVCTGVSDQNRQRLDDLYAEGARVIAVAEREEPGVDHLPADQPDGFTLAGYLSFTDRPKADAAASLQRLAQIGVAVKVATGDAAPVAVKVCRDLGLDPGTPVTGTDIGGMDDNQLYEAVHRTAVLARVSPDQKARIIKVLRRDHTVGFMGDGVNDAPALHSADVGISVDTATDVAKDAADVVLLDKSLDVIADGILSGRRIFANTIKYVQMGTSSNFGNMFSAAVASVVLPFLPMLPGQILLNNLLYDTSQLAIPTDRVDEETLRKPAHWDIKEIRRFMLAFGPVSSIFDFVTFGLMLFVLHAGQPEFRAGWFVESLATQTLIVFVIRTRRVPFLRSRPSTAMMATVAAVVAVGAVLPYTPVNHLLGFNPLPVPFFLALVAIVVVYLVLVEIVKALLFRPSGPRPVVSHAHTRHLPPAGFGHAQRQQRHRRRRARYFSHQAVAGNRIDARPAGPPNHRPA